MSKYPESHPRYKLHIYEGVLNLYYETGMETQGVIFHDNRGNHEAPHWDVKNHANETVNYHSLEWVIWFQCAFFRYNIKIFDKENNVVYEGSLTNDKRKIVASKYAFSFLPKEIDKIKWIKYCVEGYRTELHTNQLTMALEKEYNLEHKIGSFVHDDLTSKDVLLFNVTFGKDKTIGYWVNDDYLEGGRHPWELSQIDWRKK